MSTGTLGKKFALAVTHIAGIKQRRLQLAFQAIIQSLMYGVGGIIHLMKSLKDIVVRICFHFSCIYFTVNLDLPSKTERQYFPLEGKYTVNTQIFTFQMYHLKSVPGSIRSRPCPKRQNAIWFK